MDETPQQTATAGSLTHSALWLMLGKTLGFAFAMALPLSLVRILNQHEFGLYKQAFLIVNTAVWVLPLGFGMSTFYFLPRETDRRPSVVFHVVLFNLVMGSLAGLVLVLRPSILGTLFKAPEIVENAPLIGVVIATSVVGSFIEIAVVANQEARLATIFIVLSQFTKAGLLLGTTVVFGTVRALVVAAIVQGALQTVVLLFYLRSRFGHFWRRADWRMLREQLAYAMPLGLSGLLYISQTDVHNYFVASRYGPAAYAVYAVGCFDLPLIGLLAESVGSVLIPRVSVLEKRGELREITLLILRVMRKLSALYFPLYGFMLVLGREFVSVVFTEQYAASWPILAVNMATLPLSIITLDPILRAFGRLSHFLLRLRLVILVVQMSVLWLVTARFGLLAVISVVVATKMIEYAILSIRAARMLGVARRDLALLRDVGKVAVATVGAAATGALVRMVLGAAPPWQVLIVGGAAYAGAYVLSVWLTGVLTADECEDISRRVKVLRWQTLWRRFGEPQAS